jgi:transposase
MNGKWSTQQEIAHARELYLSGKNIDEVAGIMSCGKSSIHRWCTGIIRKGNKQRIAKGRELYLQGLSAGKVAIILGVSRGAVELWCSDIIRDKSECKKGKNNPAWRGGVATLRDILRKTKEYKDWYMAVLRRDKYKCTECGSKKKLEIHHRRPVSLFPELRMSMENSVVLCRECHTKTDSYMKPIKQLMQIQF